MREEKLRHIFSENLRRLLKDNDKQPVDLVNDLGVPFSTVSNWINGLKFPRMGKVELLADYFNVEKSDLIEEKVETNNFRLARDERDLIVAYRKTDDLTRQMVLRLLKMEPKNKESTETA